MYAEQTPEYSNNGLRQSLIVQLGLHKAAQLNLDYCKFSESPLWSAQRSYFLRQHMYAGASEPSSYNTSTSQEHAYSYAKIVVQYWEEAVALGQASPASTFSLLEIGCGSGEFSFHLLQAMERELALSSLYPCEWRLICTDIAAAGLNLTAQHPLLRTQIQSGHLQLGVFDTEADPCIRLRNGEIISSLKNAPAVVANHVFDHITQDIFHLHYGQIYEGMVALVDKQPRNAPERLHSSIALEQPFADLDLDFQWEPSDSLDRLEARQQHLLVQLRDEFDSNLLLFPTGAMNSILNIKRLCFSDCLLLSKNTGTTTEQDIRLARTPKLDCHGSFSLPLHFQVVDRFVQLLGGLSMSQSSGQLPQKNPHSAAGNVYNACLFGEHHHYTHTQRRIVSELHDKSRLGTDEIINTLLDKNAPSTAVDASLLLACLEKSNYSPKTFSKLSEALIATIQDLTPNDRAKWREAIEHTWQNLYLHGQDANMVFDMGVIALEVGYPGLAHRAFTFLMKSIPDEPSTVINRVLALMKLGRWNEARETLISAKDRNAIDVDDVENLLGLCNEECRYLEPFSDCSAFHSGENPIYFRPLTKSYTDELLDQFRDFNISALTRLPIWQSREELEAWIDENTNHDRRHCFAIMEENVGFCGIVGVNLSEDALYFYFCVGTDFQNFGIGQRALELLRKLAKDLGVRHIFSGVYNNNYRSRHVLQKSAFELLNCAAHEPDNDLCFYHYDGGVGAVDYEQKLGALLSAVDSDIRLDITCAQTR